MKKFNIDTCINITDNYLELLDKSAKKMKITRNELVVKLIMAYLARQKNKYQIFTRVKYQSKQDYEKWSPIHVWLSQELYEKCQNLRVFQKLSVSFILTKSIEQYLDYILKGETDNYTHTYLCFFTKLNNCHFFIILWEYPGEKILTKLLKLL